MTIVSLTATAVMRIKLAGLSLSSFLLLSVGCLNAFAQTPSPPMLEPGKPIERSLKGGETHNYQIKLKAGQYVHTEVEPQISFDLIVSLYGPDGKFLVDMNAASGFLWREAVSCVAESEGMYRIEVKTVSQSALAGSYTITASKVHKPNDVDRARVSAEKAFSEGRKIYLQPTDTTAEAIKHYQQALTLWAQVGDKFWEAVTRTNIGWAQGDLSQDDQSLKSLNQALNTFQEIKDRIGEGKTINGLGTAYQNLRQSEKAREMFDRALAIRRELNDRRGEANTLGNLGSVFKSVGKLDLATARYQEDLTIRRELKDRASEADCLNKLAEIQIILGNNRDARSKYEEVLKIVIDLKYRSDEALALYNLATIDNGLGDYDKAIGEYEKALAIRHELKQRNFESLVLIALGGLYNFGLHDNEKARNYFEQGLTAARDSKRSNLEALGLTGLGIVATNENLLEKSIEYYEGARKVARSGSDYTGERFALDQLGDTNRRMKRYKQAQDYYEQAIKLSRDHTDRNGEGQELSSMALVYADLGDFGKVRALYEAALKAFNEANNLLGKMSALSGLGFAYSNLNDLEKAVGYFEQERDIATHSGNRSYESLAHLSLGGSYFRVGQYESAKNEYQTALAINRELKDRKAEANLLNGLGNIEAETSVYESARDYHTQALKIFRDLKDRNGESNCLINLGNVEYHLANYDSAKMLYAQALEIKSQIKESQGKDTVLNNLGAVSNELNQYEQAKGFFDQSTALARETRNRVTEGLAIRNTGDVFFADRSQYEKARTFYEQSLATAREIKDRKNEAGALDALGRVDLNLSEYEKAREEYQQALDIFQQLKNRASEAAVLNNLGYLYNSLGQCDKARNYLEQALVIEREIKDRRGEASTLDILGLTDKNANEYEKARDHFSQSLAVFREIKVRRGEAGSLNDLGDIENRLGQHEKAMEDLNHALSIFREIRDRRSEGNALDNIGTVYQSLQQFEKAGQSYLRALAIFREIKVRQDEGDTLKHLMENCKLKGQPQAAILYGKLAINSYQEVRGGIKRFEQETRQSFLKDKETAYRMLASLLVSQGRLPEARAVLDLLKKEEFAAGVQRSPETDSVPLSPEESKAIEIAKRVALIAREFDELVQKGDALDEAGRMRKRQLRDELVLANSEYDKSVSALSSSVKKGETYRSASRRALAFKAQLQDLGAGTVALYTVINSDSEGKKRKTMDAAVILVTPNFERAYPIDVEGFDQDVLNFQMALKNPAYDPRPFAEKLYRKIFLQPSGRRRTTLADDLAVYLRNRSDKVLMWSLDGVLRYVPMAALHDGKQYLVEKYRNVVITPESTGWLLIDPKPHWSALGLGVSEDREEDGIKFTGLPGADAELKHIIKEGDASFGILPGVIKENKEFTKDAMIDGLLSNSRPVVHISSHFSYQPANFEKSFLLLGQGRWTVEEMSTETNLFGRVDLLTLSACDTAMGQGNGEDAEGFAFRAQRLGARAVIASLWPVDDVGTQVLMPTFYRLRETGLTKAEAFQRAQLALLHGEVKEKPGTPRSSQLVRSDKTEPGLTHYVADSQRPFAHPYYWAPFILIGNWK
jgi:tetratricopeptide (TPR) repeat protein